MEAKIFQQKFVLNKQNGNGALLLDFWQAIRYSIRKQSAEICDEAPA